MRSTHTELEELIAEISNPDFKVYSHGVFGCFGELGHFLKETRGPSKKIREYADEEREYVFLFREETDGPEFKARVWKEKVDEGLTFRLIFNDRKGDIRGASHTDYTLLVPESKISQVGPSINSNPSVLIEIFRRVFPNYDRSEGTLTMHQVNPYWEKR